ncbi:MAG: hypothetical protein QOE90_826 [Thermoplasmata archaeon]|nr:hypothetical protein [Thermoplasmata archaeon]
MSFCARCGAPLAPGVSFCTSCGALASAPASVAPAWVQPVEPRGPRPVGRTLEPWLVPLLVFITLGIYALVWLWRVSQEVDAFTGRPERAHPRVRTGVWLAVAAAVALVLALVVLVPVAVRNAGADTLAPDDEAATALGGLVILAGGAIGLAAAIFLLVGGWRVWEAIREDERRRGVVSALSPGLMLAFLLIPYVNLVTSWIVYWRTQKGLNGMWAAQTG